uniref:Uncharacterized protein n=1 Tax=Kalanchoe fedtschenkoi TaxID=63787 RepID=A0A7N0R8I7_KALFE
MDISGRKILGPDLIYKPPIYLLESQSDQFFCTWFSYELFTHWPATIIRFSSSLPIRRELFDQFKPTKMARDLRFVKPGMEVAPSLISCPYKGSDSPRLETIREDHAEEFYHKFDDEDD